MPGGIAFSGALFDDPFFGAVGAVGISADMPWTRQVSIAGREYVIDAKQYSRTTIQALRQPRDQSVEPGEQTLNAEGLWRRSQENWTLGAGQTFLDNLASLYNLYERAGEDFSLRTRFLASKGINPHTIGQISLLNDTQEKIASVNTDLQLLAINGQYMYMVDGKECYFIADPTLASWSTRTAVGSQVGKTPANITSITTDGNVVWMACGANGISQTALGANTSTVAWSAYNATGITYANGRLIAWNGNVVVEVKRDGTTTALFTHPNTSFVFDGAIGTPDAIYLFGHCGDRSDVYFTTVNTSTFALSTPVFAAGLPAGETITCMGYYGGAVAIGSTTGIRIAQINTTLSLTYGPLVLVPGGASCMAFHGEFAWFGMSSFTDKDGNVSSGLGRLNLAKFVSALVPAWATDIMGPNATTGTVNSAAVFGTLQFFVIQGVGFYGGYANLVASGYIDSGWIRFGTTEPKTAVSIDMKHEALAAGAAVQASLVYFDNSTYVIGSSATTGSNGPSSPLGINQAMNEKAQIRLVMTRGTTPTTGPIVHRYTLRALVTPRRMDEIVVPVMLQQVVNTIETEGQDIYQDVLAEYQTLRSLCNAGTITTYIEGTTSYQVYIDRLEVKAEKWNDDRSFFECLLMVRLLTVET